MVHVRKTLLACLSAISLFIVAPSSADVEKHENLRILIPKGKERFTGRILYGSPSKAKLFIGWTRPLSEIDALSAEFAADLNAVNMELHLDWVHSFGEFTIAPGIATSFGHGSPAEGNRIFIFRDVGPSLFLEYLIPELELRSFTDFWIPIQESQTTALWQLRTRLWGVLKWNDIGAGARYEVEATKDGNAGFALHEMWIGLFLIKYWQSAVFSLFLGYDTVSMPSFQGLPKDAGFVFRGYFAQAF